MTIASWMLYAHRPRAGRSSDADVEAGDLDASDRDTDHGHSSGRSCRLRHRDGKVDRDATWTRSTAAPAAHAARHVCHRASTHAERESVQLSCSISESGRDVSKNLGPGASRLRLARTEQLPDAVLQARARLLQRLRCVSPTTIRQNTTAANISQYEPAGTEDFGFVNPTEYEALTNLDNDAVAGLDFVDRLKMSKRPGLTCEAFSSLQQEVFKGEEQADQNTGLLECCICLEKFQNGESLVKLHCRHRFHLVCLQPWVRISADCPFCRASLIY